MRVMGIDLALAKTGIVIMSTEEDEPRKVICAQCIQTAKQHPEVSKDVVMRAKGIKQAIEHLIVTYGTTHIVIEGLSYGSHGDATRKLAMVYGIILSGLKLPYVEVPPTQLKKEATGRGNASKAAMLAAIHELDEPFHDKIKTIAETKGKYDIADAYHLADYGVKHYASRDV